MKLNLGIVRKKEEPRDIEYTGATHPEGVSELPKKLVLEYRDPDRSRNKYGLPTTGQSDADGTDLGFPDYSPVRLALEKITSRKPFSYDLNGDALYQQYKDNYINQGRMAMADAVGQAAAMTGGYDNSYAQTVGQQIYNGYLQELNNRIPELYSLALEKYKSEGDELTNRYALLKDDYDTRLSDRLHQLEYEYQNSTGSGTTGSAGGLTAKELADISTTSAELYDKKGQKGLSAYLNGLVNRGMLTADEAADLLEAYGDGKSDGLGGPAEAALIGANLFGSDTPSTDKKKRTGKRQYAIKGKDIYGGRNGNI